MQSRIKKIKENVEILDKRAYFTISEDCEVKRKEMNFIIPTAVFCDSEQLFNEVLEKESNKIEREKRKKIDRFSNLEIEKIRENFIKLVIKGELEFSKKYGKELALRDKELFIKTLFELSLMDNIEHNKPLMALAMDKILKEMGWIDEIGGLVISYFAKQRFDLNDLEKAEEILENVNIESDTLEVVCYKKVLEKFEYKNKKKYMAILKKNMNLKKEKTVLREEILKNIK